MKSTLENIKSDIIDFLKTNKEILFNERDFQMHLATWLRNSPQSYDDVDVEYFIPHQLLDNYVWKSEIRLDIVVRKGSEYYPIELKYKTKAICQNLKRFGEELEDRIMVVKNHGAQDLGMYEFWKDVRRIELIRNRFKAVKGGLAVFVTNDGHYLRGGKDTSNHINFSMTAGLHSKNKNWLRPNSISSTTHPNFNVDKEYNISWDKCIICGETFNYCILEV